MKLSILDQKEYEWIKKSDFYHTLIHKEKEKEYELIKKSIFYNTLIYKELEKELEKEEENEELEKEKEEKEKEEEELEKEKEENEELEKEKEENEELEKEKEKNEELENEEKEKEENEELEKELEENEELEKELEEEEELELDLEEKFAKGEELEEELEKLKEEFDLKICSENTKDINLFLDISDLWIVYFYPIKFYDLLFKTRPVGYLEELFKNTKNTFYNFLILILTVKKDNLLNTILKEGRLDLLIWSHKNYEWNKKLVFLLQNMDNWNV